MNNFSCEISRIEDLTPQIKRVILRTDNPVQFQAGQYLQVVLSATDKRAFSIASAAPQTDEGTTELELHIGLPPDNDYVQQAFAHMQAGPFTIEAPLGNAALRPQWQKPTVLMAGGTGFSYTWSILQTILQQPLKEPLFLYWGVRHQDDLYAITELQQLAEAHPRFRFIPVVQSPDAVWQGRTGLVHQAIMQDFTSLEPYVVYLAGRFEMAGVAREAFHEKGLLPDHLFGDAYEFI